MRTSLQETKHSAPTRTALHPAPAPRTTTHRFDSFRTFLGTLLFLVLATFLTSATLVDIAERMEFGPERDRWLRTAQVVDDASATLYLDRPGQWIRSVVNYEEGPGIQNDTDQVVLGELAVADATDTPAALPAEADSTADQQDPQAPPDEQPVTTTPEPEDNSDPTDDEPEPEPAPPTTEPEPQLRSISPESPLRIWLGGDSLGQFMAADIAYRIAPPARTEVSIDYHISTGLARPDYFDWPAHFSGVASEEQRPEAFIYMVGGNDDQAMRLQSVALEVNTPEWSEEYRRRVGLLMDVVAYADTRLIWVLLPPMKDDRRETISNEINRIVAEQSQLRPWVSVVDLDDLFVDGDGNYSRFVDDPNGTQQLARQADGVHITEVASEWVAQRVWTEIASQWPTVEAEGTDPSEDGLTTTPATISVSE